MKMLMLWIFVGFIVLLVVFLLGPRIGLEPAYDPIDLPEDLDRYLAENEAKFGDIIEGTEKTIVWADPVTKGKTEYAVVYIHGFGASLPETRPLTDLVAKAFGANIFYTRLVGHGRNGEAFSDAKASDWVQDAHEGLEVGRRLGEKVIIIGCSTGATLATWLCHFEKGKDIEGMVMFSPNFGPKDPRTKYLYYPWARYFVPKVFGATYSWTTPNEEVMKYYMTDHRVDVIFEMMALVKYVKDMNLSEIHAPTIVFYSEEDQVVEAKEIESTMARFDAARVEVVKVESTGDPNNHLVVGDIWSPDNNEWIAERIISFLKSE